MMLRFLEFSGGQLGSSNCVRLAEPRPVFLAGLIMRIFVSATLVGVAAPFVPSLALAATPTAPAAKTVSKNCLDRDGRWVTARRPAYCGVYLMGSNNLPTLRLADIRWKTSSSGRADLAFTDEWGSKVIRRVPNAKFGFIHPKRTSYVPSTGNAGWEYSKITADGKTYGIR